MGLWVRDRLLPEERLVSACFGAIILFFIVNKTRAAETQRQSPTNLNHGSPTHTRVPCFAWFAARRLPCRVVRVSPRLQPSPSMWCGSRGATVRTYVRTYGPGPYTASITRRRCVELPPAPRSPRARCSGVPWDGPSGLWATPRSPLRSLPDATESGSLFRALVFPSSGRHT